MADQRVLEVRIVGNASQLEAALGKSAAAVSGFGKRMDSLGKSVTATGRTLTRDLTLPIVGVAVAATKMALTFDSEMRLVQTQAGASAGEVKKMHAAVLELAKTTPEGPNKLAEALYRVESAGIRGGKAVQVLTAAAHLAEIGHANLEQATYGLVSAVKSGIDGAQNFTQAIGTMNATVGQGNMRMDDLTAAFSTGILPMAKAAGVSLSEVGAALDVFTNRGKPAQQSATGITRALAQMLAPTKAGTKALADLGIGGDTLAKDLRSGGLIKAVDDLKTHFDAQHGSIQATRDILDAFGKSKGGAQMLLLVQNADQLRVGLEKLKATSGQVGAALAATQQEASTKIQTAWSSIQASLIKVGEGLAPIAARFAGFAANVVAGFQRLSPGAQSFIEKTLAIGAAVGPAMLVIGRLISVVSRLGMMLRFVATSPMGLFVGALGLIAGVIATRYVGSMLQAQSSTDGFTQSVNRAMGATRTLKTAFDNLGQAARNITGAHLQEKAAVLALEAAHKNVAATIKQYGKNSLEARTAMNQEAQAALQVKQAHADAKTAIAAHTVAVKQHWAAIGQVISKYRDILTATEATAQKQKQAAQTVAELTKRYGDHLQAADMATRGTQHLGEQMAQAQQILEPAKRNAAEYATKMRALGSEASIAGLKFQEMGDKNAASAEFQVRKLAEASAALALKLGRIPTKTEIKIEAHKSELQIISDMLGQKLPDAAKTGAQKTAGGFKAGMTQLGPIGRTEGRKAGAAIIDGTIGGVQAGAGRLAAAAASVVRTAMATAGAIAHGSGPWQFTRQEVGAPLMQGVAQGITDSMNVVSVAMSSGLKRAVNMVAINAEVRAAGLVLGQAQAQSIADGILGKMPGVEGQIKQALRQAVQQAMTTATQAVTTSQAGFVSAFSALASAAMAAFDSKMAAWQSPAAKKLAAMQAEDQAKQLQDTLGTAQKQLGTDTAAGADAATLASDQAAIDAAQRAIDEAALAKTATDEQAAHDKLAAQKRENLSSDLTQLQTWIGKHPGEHAKIHQKILALEKKYGIKGGELWNAGNLQGLALADGLNAAAKDVEKAAGALAAAITKKLGLTIRVSVGAGVSSPSGGSASPGASFADGGGPTRAGLALLHADEYVLRAAATRKIGIPALDRLNKFGAFKDGGPVAPDGLLPPLGPGQKLDPTTGTPDVPAYRAAAMYLNDAGRDKNDTPILTALIGALGPRAQAQAALRHTTTFDGHELRQGSWRGTGGVVDSKLIALWKAAYPKVVFETGTPGQQISWMQAASRLPLGGQEIGGYIQQAYAGGSKAGSALEHVMSHAVHFEQGGRTLADGLAFLHKNEAIVPLPRNHVWTGEGGGSGRGDHYEIHNHFEGTILGGDARKLARDLLDPMHSELVRKSRRVQTLGFK